MALLVRLRRQPQTQPLEVGVISADFSKALSTSLEAFPRKSRSKRNLFEAFSPNWAGP